MGVAQDFKSIFDGITFHLIENVRGVGKFRSDYIDIPEDKIEIYFELIVSLKDRFYLPQTILIQDIYNSVDKIHDISQFQNMPIRTHILFRTNEKAV